MAAVLVRSFKPIMGMNRAWACPWMHHFHCIPSKPCVKDRRKLLFFLLVDGGGGSGEILVFPPPPPFLYMLISRRNCALCFSFYDLRELSIGLHSICHWTSIVGHSFEYLSKFFFLMGDPPSSGMFESLKVMNWRECGLICLQNTNIYKFFEEYLEGAVFYCWIYHK